MERPALPGPGDRDQHVGDDLGLGQGGGPVAGEQLDGRHRAVALSISGGTADHDPGPGGQRAAADLGGRVGVGQAAGDRAAVADPDVPDVPDRLGEQRAVLADQVVLEQDPVPGQGGQPEQFAGMCRARWASAGRPG